MKPGNVPTARVAPLLRRMIAERWPDGEGCDVLGDKVGCHPDTIRAILNQKNEGVEFDLVDKLFCALGYLGRWQGELEKVYDSVVFMETCSLHSCNKIFHEKVVNGWRVRYCSPQCRRLASKVRHRKATGDRHVLRGRFKCGHKMTAENTSWVSEKQRTCRTCRLEKRRIYNARYRAKNSAVAA